MSFGAGRRLRRPSPSGGGRSRSLGRFLVQAADLVGQLGAVADPMVDAGDVQDDALLVARSNRVVVTDTLDVSAVAGAARVGDDDVVERTLLRAAAGKTDLAHGLLVFPSRDDGGVSRLFYTIRHARKTCRD